MRRREFIALLGGAVAWPLGAGAQQAGKIYRIGFLGVTSLAEYGDRVEAVRTGLRRLGYEEGKNIVIHYRWADGRYDRLPELAAELVQLNVDVIVTHSTPGDRGRPSMPPLLSQSWPILAIPLKLGWWTV
jgi:ABC-type uncharacterized transport system substrate-binding protein